MSRTAIVTLGLLVASLVLGLLAGNWFYGLYEGAIPDALKATVSLQGTRLVFWMNGLGLGIVMFALTAAALGLGRWTRTASGSGHTNP